MNDHVMTIMTMAMWLLLPVLTTVSVAVTPWVTDRREAFGVTVPPAAFADTRVHGLRNNYSLTVGCFGGMLVLVSLGVWRGFGLTAAFWCATIASLLVMLLGFVWLQRCRREVIAIKAERGWKSAGVRHVAVIDDSLPRPLPLWWDLVYIAIIVVTLGIGLTLQLSILGLVPLGTVGAIGMLAATLAIIGCIIVALFYGQNGSHLSDAKDGEADETMSSDDDRHWYGGAFYANPDDPAVWVPKRFGVGWTVNLARPSAWVGIVVLVAIAVVSIALAMLQ